MADSIRTRLFMNDLKDFQKETNNGICLMDTSDDLSHIKVKVSGEVGTPFEGGNYDVEFVVPGDFPFNPPEVFFRTPVWHPNVKESNGRICMNILSENCGISIIECAEAARALLNNPNANSPLNPSAAILCEVNINLYRETAKLWSRLYAGGTLSTPALDEKLSILCALGMTESVAVRQGAAMSWDMKAIVSSLSHYFPSLSLCQCL